HHGRIPATRTEKGRELFTRLAPRLLTALAETGAPDAAFGRFAVFFSNLLTGVQVQALFLNQPKLFDLIVGVMAYAPRLAQQLGRRPAALDSILDARFQAELDTETGLVEQIRQEAEGADDFEKSLDAVRRIFKEQSFRIGLHLLTGRAEPAAAGRAYTTLADAAIESLAPAALKEAQRQGGRLSSGAVAVVALGKAGSREMTAGSDLDLMTLYEAPADVVTTGKAWSAEVFYIRFTQRLISALSAHTAEGGLYEVDMRLWPTGSKGPVSVRLSGFEHYYEAEADTWEFMVLTRARVVWASRPDFGRKVETSIEAALRRPRPDADMAGDVKKMRALMDRERPGRGFWDM
ncbi:MAG: glutamine-synthetase adenylyltransferase, partial [Brevundimonas sp.]